MWESISFAHLRIQWKHIQGQITTHLRPPHICILKSFNDGYNQLKSNILWFINKNMALKFAKYIQLILNSY